MNATPRADAEEKRDREVYERLREAGDPSFDISPYFLARTLETELARLRAEVEKWQGVAAQMSSEREHNANEVGRLRAEVERLNALGSWAHTCIHHTDEQRARAERCSVCATAERDQLRVDCENETKWAAHYLAQAIAEEARAERAEAEVEKWQSIARYYGECKFNAGVKTPQL